MRYTVYDIETISNLFTACFKDYATDRKKEFIIHESRNDFAELISFLVKLQKSDYYLVGFNSIEFDGQVLNFIMDNASQLSLLSSERLARAIYRKAQDVITVPEQERFLNNLPEWKLNIRPIDLYKQKHYDGKAKRTSLKWLEFTMRLPNIEEMPLPHDVDVTEQQISSILSYNWNDVDATTEFFERNLFETELRLKLSKQFDINILNASEPRMSREILASLLAKDMGISVKELKDKRTFRKEIHLGRCIIPLIKFSEQPFLDLVTKLNRTTINAANTKGCFEHSINYKGVDIEYGVGGVHGMTKSGIYTSDEEYVIKTVDVVSFYPCMIINYGFVPAHLGTTFANRYKWFFTERRKYAKKDPINYIYKIILNSTYGLSNDMNSFLYDPLVTMKTTINGQLLLSMLAESLSGIPESQLLMMNTDGLEIRIHRKDEELFNTRCRVWEELTGLQLEHDAYDKIILGDVNSYIGVFTKKEAKSEADWKAMQESDPYSLYTTDGDKYYYAPVKLKGRFELKLDYHKNPSGMIIPITIYEHLVRGIPVEDAIDKGDIFDYCYGVKKKYDFDLIVHSVHKGEHIMKKQQKVMRFYVSTDGGKLVKQYNDGRILSVNASALVTPANHITNQTIPSNLNRKYYIDEVYKELDGIIPKQSNQLALF